MEMVKIRLQTQKTSIYKNSLDLLSHIYKKEGYRGVFRGLNITILREAPGFGSFFACYEYLTKTQNSEPISTPHMLMAGGTAGAVSWLLAYPVDVIKTRVQVDGMSGEFFMVISTILWYNSYHICFSYFLLISCLLFVTELGIHDMIYPTDLT